MNWLLLALVPACFALNPVIGRALTDTFGPATLSVVRWSLSAVVIAAIAAARGPAEHWRAPPLLTVRIALLGALGMGFCAYAAFIAAHTAEATNIALIYGCAAALVAAWEIAAGRQRASLSLLLGIGVCLVGVVLILTRGRPGILRDWTPVVGDIWAAAGMLAFVVYTVALRRTPVVLTPMPQFVVMAGAATLALLPFAAGEIASSGLPPLHGRTLPWIAAVVLLAGIGAFLGYNISLSGARHRADRRAPRLVSRHRRGPGGDGAAAHQPWAGRRRRAQNAGRGSNPSTHQDVSFFFGSLRGPPPAMGLPIGQVY
jgi:drug/metabolite transporter (DMT)-like permease